MFEFSKKKLHSSFLLTTVIRSKSKEAEKIGLTESQFRMILDVSVRIERCIEPEQLILPRPRKIVNRRQMVTIGGVQRANKINLRRPTEKLERQPFYISYRRPSITAYYNQGFFQWFRLILFYHVSKNFLSLFHLTKLQLMMHIKSPHIK